MNLRAKTFSLSLQSSTAFIFMALLLRSLIMSRYSQEETHINSQQSDPGQGCHGRCTEYDGQSHFGAGQPG